MKNRSICLLFADASLLSGGITIGYFVEGLQVHHFIAMILLAVGGYLFAKSEINK